MTPKERELLLELTSQVARITTTQQECSMLIQMARSVRKEYAALVNAAEAEEKAYDS